MKSSFLRALFFVPLINLFSIFPAIAEKDRSSFVAHWNDMVVKKIGKNGLLEKRPIMRGQTLDLKRLTIASYTIDVKATAPKRKRATIFEELIIIKEGELEVILNGHSKRMGAGSVLVTYPGDERLLKNVGNNVATYYAFNYMTKSPLNKERGEKAGGSFMVDWDEVAYKKSDIGGRRDIFNRSTSMFKTFEMHVSTLNQGLTNHAAHTHRAEEFVLMMKGEVKMLVGENTYSATTGDIIYIESMIPHSLNNTGKGETVYFAFQFWQ